MNPIGIQELISHKGVMPERTLVAGYVLQCPTGGSDGLGEEYSYHLYLAPTLEESDELEKCILIDDSNLFTSLLQSGMSLTVGGKYGGVCYECVVQGQFTKQRIGPFPAYIRRLELVEVTVPSEEQDAGATVISVAGS